MRANEVAAAKSAQMFSLSLPISPVTEECWETHAQIRHQDKYLHRALRGGPGMVARSSWWLIS